MPKTEFKNSEKALMDDLYALAHRLNDYDARDHRMPSGITHPQDYEAGIYVSSMEILALIGEHKLRGEKKADGDEAARAVLYAMHLLRSTNLSPAALAEVEQIEAEYGKIDSVDVWPGHPTNLPATAAVSCLAGGCNWGDPSNPNCCSFSPAADQPSLAEFLKVHRRNEVIEPGPAGNHGEIEVDWPGRTRVKCDGESCDFYGIFETWFLACSAHEAHLAEELAKRG